jgi:hypothetical protein
LKELSPTTGREPSARTGLKRLLVSLGSRNSLSHPEEENHQPELGRESVGFSMFKELSLTPGRRELSILVTST